MASPSNISAFEKDRANPFMVSFLTLRKVVGFIAFGIAPVLVLITLLGSDCSMVQDSISHYYYTMAGDVFVGLLCAVAFFLMAYPGYDAMDNRLTNAAGFLALGIAFFPTSPMQGASCSVLQITIGKWVPWVHYGSAALFFGILAYMAIWVFTKSSETDPAKRTRSKRQRNRIYRVCGVLMLFAIAAMATQMFSDGIAQAFETYNLTYWFEFLALVSFGICWMVKGEILRDISGMLGMETAENA